MPVARPGLADLIRAHRIELAIAAGLFLLIAVFYADALPGELVLDSRSVIGDDPRIRACTDENIWLIFTKNYWWPTFEVELYRPLTTLSYLFNYAILGNGPRPAGYHVLNLLLHWIDALLVFAIARRLLGHLAAAAFVAAVFAVHPLQTEVVTNIVGRADLLAAFFLLLGLYLHVLSRQEPANRSGLIRIGLGTAAALAVLCKESGAVLLGLMLLYDLIWLAWPSGKSAREVPRSWLRQGNWKNYAAILPSLVLLAGMRYLLNLASPMFGQIGADNPMAFADFWTGRMTAVKVLGYYLALFVWPARLSCDYSYDEIPLFGWTFSGPDRDAWIALAVLVALTALAVVTWRRQKAACFFLGFAVVTLLPASNLLLTVGSIMGERFMYLSVAGLTAGIVALYLNVRPTIVSGTARWLGPMMAGALILALGCRTAVRNLDWHDEMRLFSAAVRDCPNSFKVYKGLATAIAHNDPNTERLDQAIAAAEKGLAIIDAKPLPLLHVPTGLLLDLGRYYGRFGQNLALAVGPHASPPPEAIGYYKKSLAVLERAVKTDRAVNRASHEKRLALGQKPAEIYDVGLPEVYDVLATVQHVLGNDIAAVEACSYSIRLSPVRPAPYITLALIHEQYQRWDDVAVNCLEAMVLRDAQPSTMARLSQAYAKLQPGGRSLVDASGRSVLNEDDPLARGHLNRACFDIVRNALDSQHLTDAREVAEIAVKQYHCPREIFAQLFNPAQPQPAVSR